MKRLVATVEQGREIRVRHTLAKTQELVMWSPRRAWVTRARVYKDGLVSTAKEESAETEN